ncbi:uncharacterized protein LOC125784355 [Astyanax mexicanus]|uniref:uncharacterized protein LOC125784355 n=1 Tax=Astyanax mexicanus TaxID=7994 RepID=UPI0020CADF70|nr:uncharacterized protein LOC125784355 [Astyanax mexicanus]
MTTEAVETQNYKTPIKEVMSFRKKPSCYQQEMPSVSSSTTQPKLASSRAERVENSYTMSVGKVKIPPKILLSPNCSEWAGGLFCVCRAEAEPKANVSWTVDGRHALFPQFNITTSYSDTVTVSELTGPLTGNVSCTASNYLSTDLHHTTVLIPQSDGNSVIIATVAAVCVILGVTVVAVYLRRRRQIPQHSTSSQRACSNENLSKTADVCESNLYGNNVKDDDIYANTMEIEEISTEKKNKRRKAPEPKYFIDDMDDIYANC